MTQKIGKSDVASAILKQLKDPFEPSLVKTRPGGGKALSYIDARDVMKRLDEVMGTENWQDKYIAVDGGFVCELSLRIDGEWITKANGANNTKVEPLKGGISGALKRAAVEWGIGRYLYYEPNKKQYPKFNPTNPETWPKWRLPGAVEDWEDVAEMEAELDSGMDEEESFGAGVTKLAELQAIDNLDVLKKFEENLDETSRRLLADHIANKADELTRNDTSS